MAGFSTALSLQDFDFLSAQEADAIDESFVDGILSDRFNGLDMASVSATVSQINLRLLSVPLWHALYN